MANNHEGLASGADFDAQTTRRRIVPSTSSPEAVVDRVEIDNKKTQVKKVMPVHFY
jgi:dolichyl-phosphate-mannose-protein mannosyltransferase